MVSKLAGLTPDTLRDYERRGLLKAVNRTVAGITLYNERDLSRLRFIQRAHSMNFRLTEISALLQMRDDPCRARDEVRELTAGKLTSPTSELVPRKQRRLSYFREHDPANSS